VPSDGTPEPITTPDQLEQVIARLATGAGPVAVDAERASGYRYTHRAYLIQVRRAGAGTALIDPIPFGDLTRLGEVIVEVEWVLHAASQDLPCLAEIGLRPRHLFDTELAARLLGYERVGLAALTEQLLGRSLEKHHSAADWSTRPLPSPWLTYAALDVELLVDLRDVLAAELDRAGKREWARQEFAALVATGWRPPTPRPEPWRRTSGIHRIRGPRGLARVRALWYARDEIAARRDSAPGRVLPDASIIAAADLDPPDERGLLLLPGYGGRSVRRLAGAWLRALDAARALPADALPTAVVSDGPPPPHRWAEKDPIAAARLARCRAVVAELANRFTLPPENLVAPDYVRRLCWEPPDQISPQVVAALLTGFGARPWQIELIASGLAAALMPVVAEAATPPVTSE
jgi:ribonuclease D